jgi:superfamily II DNA or RNA helicase
VALPSPGHSESIGRIVTSRKHGSKKFLVVQTTFDAGSGRDLARLAPLSDPSVHRLESLALTELLPAERPLLEGRDAFSFLIARALHGSLFSEATPFLAGTEFKAYQFRPLVKFLKSPDHRILIADEVGLGKTIEAGYILLEAMALKRLRRVLVMCPSGLRQKWQQELSRRFSLNFEIISSAQLERHLASDGSFQAIVSFDSVRANSRVLSKDFDLHPIDFLVIDEVHNLIGRGGDTLRRRLGLKLSKASGSVVALSATPIQIEYDDLRRVLTVVLGKEIPKPEFDRDLQITRAIHQIQDLLRPLKSLPSGIEAEIEEILRRFGCPIKIEETVIQAVRKNGPNTGSESLRPRLPSKLEKLSPFDSLMIRNRRSEVGTPLARLVRLHPVKLDLERIEMDQGSERVSISEAQVYDEIDRFLATSFSHVHQRQLSSCPPAMINLLRLGMKGFSVWRKDDKVLGESDLLDEDSSGFETSKPSLSEEQRRKCDELANKALLIDKDTKYEKLLAILRESIPPSGQHRKMILFTQWIPTLRYLNNRLSGTPGLRVFSVSGEDNDWRLEKELDSFSHCAGNAILLTTDMLSEGIDLQVADTVINYDFPYNPQRVEQRIGRIDRIGQKAPEIYVHNIWIVGSIDGDILDILKGRLEVFSQAMGQSHRVPSKQLSSGSIKSQAVVWSHTKELMESDVFSGVEDYLDVEIRRRRASSVGALGRFAWAPVSTMLRISSRFQATVTETDEASVVGPIDDFAIEVIGNWIDVGHRAVVKSQLQSHLENNNRLTILKQPGAEGLYVPIHSMLAGIATAVVENALGTSTRRQPAAFMATSVSQADRDVVVICRFASTSGKGRVHLMYFEQSHDEKFKRTANDDLPRLMDLLQQSNMKEVPLGDWEPTNQLWELAQKELAIIAAGVAPNTDDERLDIEFVAVIDFVGGHA